MMEHILKSSPKRKHAARLNHFCRPPEGVSTGPRCCSTSRAGSEAPAQHTLQMGFCSRARGTRGEGKAATIMSTK